METNKNTKVTDEEIANGIKDEYGVLYSPDGKRLLKGNRVYEYTVKEGTEVTTKQKIGVVHTNDENRAEFNFQIWGGKDAQVESQNPRIWLAK